MDAKSARAIADALARVEAVPRRTAPHSEAVDPHTYKEAVRFVIYDLWSLFRPFSYLDPILENTWAWNVLNEMQSHERYVRESRNERLAYESPKQVAERREEKRRQRQEQHDQRLAVKKERDRRWRLAYPERHCQGEHRDDRLNG